MKRIHRLSGIAAACLVIWLGALSVLGDVAWIVASLVPLLLLVALGVYMLATLIVGVATFRTVPEEADSLKQMVTFQNVCGKSGHVTVVHDAVDLGLTVGGQLVMVFITVLAVVKQDIREAKKDLIAKGVIEENSLDT